MNLLPRSTEDLRRMYRLVFPETKPPVRKQDLVEALSEELSVPQVRTVKIASPRIPDLYRRRLLQILRSIDWESVEKRVNGKYARQLATSFSGPGARRPTRAVGVTLGITRGVPGTKGFNSRGLNRRIVSAKMRRHEAVFLELWSTLKALLQEIDPQFRFTSVQVNRNFPANRSHVDRHNLGPSYALSLGRFSGGRLIVGTDDPWTLVSFKTKDRFTRCDARHPHWVSPYKGERYSLVCYRVTGRTEPRLSNLTGVKSP